MHRYFQREWQEDAFKTKEFLFDYVPSRLHMLGVHTVEEAFALMPSLSLVDGGLIDKPTPPMLLIGGARDTQVPFSDFVLMMQHGSPKHAWVNPEGGTMGRSLTVKDDDIFRGWWCRGSGSGLKSRRHSIFSFASAITLLHRRESEWISAA